MVPLERINQVSIQVKKADNSDPYSQGFDWSFKPYIIILKLFTGAPVNSSINKRSSSYFFFLFYGVYLLITNGLINYYFAYDYLTRGMSNTTIDNNDIPASSTSQNQSPTTTEIKPLIASRTKTQSDYINMMIDMGNEVLMIFGTHFCFLVVSYIQNTSTRLWDCLLSIQTQLKLPAIYYQRIRKMVIFGILLLCSFIGTNSYLTLALGNPNQQNLRMFVVFLIMAAKTLSITILMWFFILVGSVLVLFGELEKRLKAIVKIGLSCKKGAEELKEWKKQHALVCQLVTRINKSFGLILLITFSHGFVSFITSFYRFFVILQFGDTMNCLPFLMVFIQQAVFLSIFIIASYCLQSYGPELSEVVFQLEDTSDLETQTLLNNVLIQLTQANAKITAADLFDINLTLYPVLIGSTLTYVIILLQQLLNLSRPFNI